MMKKLALVCALLLVVAGSANAAYLWYGNTTDTNNMNFGSAVTLGTSANMTSQQSWNTATCAYMGQWDVVNPTGNVAKTQLNKTKMISSLPAPTVWILEVWAGADYGMSTMDVRIWAPTGTTKPTGTWSLLKLYDPASGWLATPEKLGEINTNNFSTAGTQTTPWLKVNLPTTKPENPLAANSGYILALTVPEPGSIVAMLSGLIGLVGFGIRRRK